MTRKAMVLFGLALAVCVLTAEIALADPTAEGAPQLVLGETRYDFGTVVEGSPVSCEFVVANKGDAPLQILEMKSG
ncbi:MAG: DUF1573 domain-containing protein [Desulfobacterales bacterium]|nr:DUF1573 domain-containing protein [Desulfobacterales bacterium]